MKPSKPHKYHGRWLPWTTGMLAFAGLAGTLWALSEVLENDTDGDGWTDAEEIIAGTDPADETDPWDSDGDGIADYLEFADGTDPLDPNDPPQARGASVTMSAVAPINDDSSTNILSLPAPTWSSQQNMWHNTAWFGERLNYTFYTPAESSAWKAYAGSEIEYWSPGYYELCARNGSYGIVITLDEVPAGRYRLKWKHLERPDDGSANYTVLVSGPSRNAAFGFTAPECESVADIEEVSLTFTATDNGALQISFVPESTTNTKGPLVGAFELREVISLTEVNLNAGDGGTEFSVTQDSGAAFTGSDWVLSRTRQANPVAFQSGSALKIVPTFRLPDSTVPARIQALVTLGNSTNTYTLAWSECGNGIEIPAPVPAGTVGYFENATIVWKVCYDENSDTWEDVGTSTHEIYFTRGEPLTGESQETLFWVACSGASGKTNGEMIINSIYSAFQSLHILRKSDKKLLSYWGGSSEEDIAKSTATLLADPNGDGNCQAWSSFFRDAIRLHGIVSNRKKVSSRVRCNNETEVLLVKNWHFGTQKGEKTVLVEKFENDYFVETEMTYTHIFLPAAPSAEEGFACPGEIVRAQGNSTNPIGFNHHWIVEAAGHYYDPSYGIPKTSIADAGKSYDASAFSGFGILETIEGIMLYSIRKNNISNDDLIITTHNYNSL